MPWVDEEVLEALGQIDSEKAAWQQWAAAVASWESKHALAVAAVAAAPDTVVVAGEVEPEAWEQILH